MQIFSNLDITFQGESPVFKINEARDKIEEVSYVDAVGKITRRYVQKTSFSAFNYHNVEDGDVLNAACVLCRLNPIEFCNLYKFIQSDEIKGVLDEALAQVKSEYQIESAETPEIELPEKVYFNLGSYYISAGFPMMVTDSISFKVGTSHSLLSIVGKSKHPETGHISTDFEYGNSMTEDAIISGNLTAQRCTKYAKMLCQSSYSEYQKLLESLDPEDPYYKAILNGLNEFAYDIQTTENTIRSR